MGRLTLIEPKPTKEKDFGFFTFEEVQGSPELREHLRRQREQEAYKRKEQREKRERKKFPYGKPL